MADEDGKCCAIAVCGHAAAADARTCPTSTRRRTRRRKRRPQHLLAFKIGRQYLGAVAGNRYTSCCLSDCSWCMFRQMAMPRKRQRLACTRRARSCKPPTKLQDWIGSHRSGFKDFLLKPELLRAIVDCGFEHPSEVLISRASFLRRACGAAFC